ncbi:MAG TPA: ribosomal RNA small subunit methyltransferase A [Nanoarchaeota archaeon]|nr:ribosomal RNA small subunit methyltransferase A [Nanoarchaeota archaeon]
MRKRNRKIKALGQHFIIDESIFERECKYALLNKKDVVLEIGAGDGRLTKVISKYAGKVIAIEKDKDLVELARYNTGKNVKVIHADALEIKFPEFSKIVSNIPYSISSKILEKIFKYKWEVAVLTFQKEFALRFFAKPGERNYSRLTVMVNYYSIPELLEIIPKSKFYPKPQVDSVIVRLKRKKVPELPQDFWDMLRILFTHKKKLVKNSFEDAKVKISLPKHLAYKRVFQCTIEDFLEIYKYYKAILPPP